MSGFKLIFLMKFYWIFLTGQMLENLNILVFLTLFGGFPNYLDFYWLTLILFTLSNRCYFVLLSFKFFTLEIC